MQKTMLAAFLGLLSLGSFAAAQTQAPYNNPPVYNNAPAPAYQNAPPYENQNQNAARPNSLNPQMLGEVMRTAATFSAMVRSMNLNNALGPDQHAMGPDGQLHHSVERTAQTIGAGAGAGAALGAMSKSQNGVMIGALIGGAAGLIIDQILKEREEARAKAAVYGPAPDQGPYPNQYQYQRDQYQRDPRQLQQRDPQYQR